MEQLVAMLLQQVMEVSDRRRLSDESSEQVRQLLEAQRTAGQMLEERMNWTEASVRGTFQAGGNSAARTQEAPGADDDDSDLERLRRDTNQRTSVAKTLVGATVLGCCVPGQDDFNEDECKKLSDQWRHDLEMRLQWLNWMFDSRIGRVPS